MGILTFPLESRLFPPALKSPDPQLPTSHALFDQGRDYEWGADQAFLIAHSFMTSSAVALRFLNLAGLRLLCTISSGAGFAGILLGLRFDRKVQRSSQEACTDTVAPDSSHESSPAEFYGTQEVIQLSSDAGPTKSADMTQQQKIAAALIRAGATNSGAWSTPLSSRAGSAVMDPPPENSAAADRTPDQVSIRRHPNLSRRLFLLAGFILFFFSLILFFVIR